jgi:hypothetical protein
MRIGEHSCILNKHNRSEQYYFQPQISTTTYNITNNTDIMTDQNNSNNQTYRQQAGNFYNRQYENWMPWVEDQYLKWFTKDNKTSYAAKRMSALTKHHSLNFRLEALLTTPCRTTRQDQSYRRRSSRPTPRRRQQPRRRPSRQGRPPPTRRRHGIQGRCQQGRARWKGRQG